MKKKLEAELISIAHRILKLKNKSELDQLYLETQKLYEKLAVLKFVEQNFADVKPTIGQKAVQEILETAFDDKEPAENTENDVAQVPAAEVIPDKESPTEDTPRPDEDQDENDTETQQQKIQEPEKPEEEKLTPDATPMEQEADEVIAEAEEALANDSANEVADQGTAEKSEEKSGQESEETSAEESAEESEEELQVSQAGIDFVEPESKDEVAAAAPEIAKNDDLFKPSFEWAFDAKEDEKTDETATSAQPTSQVAFEDLLGAGYRDPVFVKPGDETRETDIPAEDNRIEPKAAVISITRREDKVPVFKINNEGTGTINDRLSKGITVGLNDRIAFVKNLFNNSNEDYNRVLSQLLTFDTFAEAENFIANMVKPDYNNWEGKEDFEQRFMEVVEKKFS